MSQKRKPLPIAIAAILLILGSLGMLMVLSALSGHPPEWILDTYYSLYPASANGEGSSGPGQIVGGVALFSVAMLSCSVALICGWTPRWPR
jgi:hypothetical protein